MRRAFSAILLTALIGCDSPPRKESTDHCANMASTSASCGPTAFSADGDWPMFRQNAAMTGVADSGLPPELHLKWEFEAGAPIASTPAIAGETVFIGADDGTMHALALSDGSPRWTYKAGEGLKSSPTVFDGVVYFGDDDGVLHAVGAADGRARWTFKTDGQIISSVNVAADRLVFGSYDAHIYCLDRAGSLLWKYKSDDRVHGTPGLGQRPRSSSNDSATATSRATTTAAASVVERIVLASGCDGRLHVVSLADGSLLRMVDLAAPCGSSVATSGDLAFLGTYGNQVLCADWNAGRIVWEFEDNDRQFPFFASAAIGNGVVFTAGRDKRLRCHDIKTGQPRWEFAAQSKIDASPVLVYDTPPATRPASAGDAAGDGRVFVGAYDGTLYAVRASDGREVWRYETGSPIAGSVAVGRGRLVVGNDDGVVYCFGGGD